MNLDKKIEDDVSSGINKDLMDMLTKSIQDQVYNIPSTYSTIAVSGSVTSPPWPMPTSSTPVPSVTDRYPITNTAWWKATSIRDFPYSDQKLLNAMKSSNGISGYIANTFLLEGELFFARLENVRPKETIEATDTHPQLGMGFTYDPWYRSITTHRGQHYSKIYRTQAGFEGEVSFQTTIGANYEEQLLLWGFNSTIDKTPINLYLYTFAEFEYVNKRKKERHLSAIHPYMASNAENYNLNENPSTNQSNWTPYNTSTWTGNTVP